MNLLCFDISSGGIAAAVFDANLQRLRFVETRWTFESGELGAATLRADLVLSQFEKTIRQLDIVEPPSALCIGTFMHNCVLLDDADQPLSPLFTWLDRRGEDGVE